MLKLEKKNETSSLSHKASRKTFFLYHLNCSRAKRYVDLKTIIIIQLPKLFVKKLLRKNRFGDLV